MDGQPQVRADMSAQLAVVKRQRNEALDTASEWEAAYWTLYQASEETIRSLQDQISALSNEPSAES